jgi:hypothetical protein
MVFCFRFKEGKQIEYPQTEPRTKEAYVKFALGGYTQFEGKKMPKPVSEEVSEVVELDPTNFLERISTGTWLVQM